MPAPNQQAAPTVTAKQAAHARADFTAFKRLIWKRYDHAPHLAALDAALMLCARHVKTGGREGIGHLIVELPPRHGKSFSVSRLFPAWFLGRNPDCRVILASYGATLAEKNSRYARKVVQMPAYRAIFPGVELSADSRAADAWDLARHEGGLDAVGVGGGITGKGGSLIAVDDPVKSREEAESPVIRDKVWDWFTDDLYTRREPGAAMVIAMTRWHCLLPTCGIMTSMGIKQISSIVSSLDEVLTSQGLQKVEAVVSKPYNGDVYSIRIYGYPEPLQVTPEHRILTVRGWNEAQRLMVGDWVVFPIPQGETNLSFIRDLIPLPMQPAPKAPSRMTGKKGHVNRDQLKQLLDEGKTYQQIADLVGLQTRSAIQNYVRLYGLERPIGNILSGDPVADPDFWFAVGLWLAEGSITYGRKSANTVRWSLGWHEKELAERLIEIIKRYGVQCNLLKVKSAAERGFSGISINCSSHQLARFLENFGKGAHGKFLPEWAVTLPIQMAQSLVAGYLIGDGTLQNGWARITSVSLSLLVGFQRLLLRLGIASNIMAGIRKWEIRFPLIEAFWLDQSQARPVEQRFSRIVGDQLHVRVKAIEIHDYQGDVYDIQTPCHDFLAHGMTVHNCDDLVGRLLHEQPDKWHVIRLPALAEENDPLGRAIGEPLWPQRFGLDVLRDIQSVLGEYAWLALYQQRPVPSEGGVFKRAHFRIIHVLPECAPVVRFWDLAMSERTSADYTAGVKLGLTPDQRIVVLDVVRRRVEWDQLAALMAETALRDGPEVRIGFERQGFMSRAGQALAQDPRLHHYAIWGYAKDQDKLTNALPFAGRAGLGIVDVIEAPWTRDYLDELCSFPRGAHDDQVDASAGAYEMLGGEPSAGAMNYADDYTIGGTY